MGVSARGVIFDKSIDNIEKCGGTMLLLKDDDTDCPKL